MDTSSETQTLIIVGASHAGSLLAVQARKEGWQGRIVLIGEEAHLPYHRPPLSKAYLSGEKTLDAIALRPLALYENNRIELRCGVTVLSISRADHTVALSTGEHLRYDKLALCTGASPRRLPLGEGLAGVHYLRNADDVDGMRGEMAPGKRAVIIGGGYIGLEVAAVMATHGMQVTVVEMSQRLLQRVASPVISDYFRLLHESHGVQVMTDLQAVHAESVAGGLQVTFSDGSSRVADLLVIGVGVIPGTSLAEVAGLEINNGIVVDAYMVTSDPDILAAGDCTVFPSARYGRCLRLESVQNAVDQARCAAATLCGKPQVYEALPWFWSDQYNVKLQSAGLRLEHEHEIVRGDPTRLDDRGIAVFYLAGNHIVAVDCINRAKEFMVCKRLISERIAVDPAALADEDVSPEAFALS